MIPEPEETTGQPEVDEVVDAEVVSAADPAQVPPLANAAAEGSLAGTVEDAQVVDDETPGEAAEASVEQDLNALIEEARSQRDEYLQVAQRTRADFENYRKRMVEESQSQLERGRLEVASGLIGAIDNLERVLEAAGIDEAVALEGEIPSHLPVAEQGVIVSYRDLLGILRKAGVEGFDSRGEVFDPNLHEALQALPKEGVESGLVIEEMQKGYRAGENVIRHARVVVSQ